jgi:glutathione S-transferase
MGDTFTVADAYLFTVLRRSAHVGVDLGKWPNIIPKHRRREEL